MKSQGQLTCSDFIKQALSGHSSIFHRLVYLADMRDASTGWYCDDALSVMFGDAEAERVLREKHQQTFAAWLCLPLQEQVADLTVYLVEITAERRETLRAWMRSKWYEKLIPSGAMEPERLLFAGDLEIVLPLMHGEAKGIPAAQRMATGAALPPA